MLSYAVASGFCESGISTTPRRYYCAPKNGCIISLPLTGVVAGWGFIISSRMQYVEDYLDRKRVCDKKKTVEQYRHWIEKFHEQTGKGINGIVFGDVVQWSEFLRENYSSGTVRFVVGATKNYLAFHQKRGLKIEADEIRVPRARTESYEPITPEEYVSMLSFVKTDTLMGLRDTVILRVLYDTGARIGEIASIERGSIDLESRTAEIWTEKTVTKRLIAWGNDTNSFLTAWMDMKAGKVFPSARTIERTVRRYAELAKIKKRIVPHSFRHGKAHLILDNGGTVKDVQETLGHLSPTSSFRYLNLNRAEKMRRLEKWLN